MEVNVCPPCHGSGRHRNSSTSSLQCGTCSGAGELDDAGLDAYWAWYQEKGATLTAAGRGLEGWWAPPGIGEELPRPVIAEVPPAVIAMFGGAGWGGPVQ